MSAEALANEANNEPLTITIKAGADEVVLGVPAKWQRFKYMRALNNGDMLGALDAAFGVAQMEKLDELLLTDVELADVLDQLTTGLAGVKSGN